MAATDVDSPQLPGTLSLPSVTSNETGEEFNCRVP